MSDIGKTKSQTNADRIRNMSDEELAEFMSENTSCYYCKVQCEDRPNSPTESSCNFRWLDWLQSEAEQERIWKIDIYLRQKDLITENG